MSRVVKKKKHKHEPKIKSRNSDFIDLNRYCICRVAVETSIDIICRALINKTSSLVSWIDLHSFNTRLELLFLEVLNTS